MDYDSQRHQLENLQRASRRDEYKIARARDALETARTTYEVLNKVCVAEAGSRPSRGLPLSSWSKQYNIQIPTRTWLSSIRRILLHLDVNYLFYYHYINP